MAIVLKVDAGQEIEVGGVKARIVGAADIQFDGFTEMDALAAELAAKGSITDFAAALTHERTNEEGDSVIVKYTGFGVPLEFPVPEPDVVVPEITGVEPEPETPTEDPVPDAPVSVPEPPAEPGPEPETPAEEPEAPEAAPGA